MKIQIVVTGCATFFATWLTITFLREVPAEEYPRLGRASLPISAQAAPVVDDTPATLEATAMAQLDAPAAPAEAHH